MKDFAPWDSEEAKRALANAVESLRLDISEPPCRHCEHFKPTVEVSASGGKPVYSGVALCHSKEMYHDFSCYEPRGEGESTE